MQNTDLEDLHLFRMSLHFFLFCSWVWCLPLSAHSGLKSCVNVPHTRAFYIKLKKKSQMLQKLLLPWVWTCPVWVVGMRIFLLWQSLGVGVFSSLTLAAGVAGPSSGPPRSHTDGWGAGGLGRGAEEFWFGTPRTPRQPGGKEGNAVGAKHNANTDCFFWKGGNPGATTEALLCCWDNSTVCCP